MFFSVDSPWPQTWVHCEGTVDSSDSGVVVVLSQCSSLDQKLHPWAFFSRWLTPLEWKYDVESCELLAVVLALQEWWPWLELSDHIWSDHKNLTCICSSPQVKFLLGFLVPFDFSYLPSQLCKVWRLISPASEDSEQETIIPPTCVVGAACWVELEVQEALHSSSFCKLDVSWISKLKWNIMHKLYLAKIHLRLQGVFLTILGISCFWGPGSRRRINKVQ